MFNQRSRIQSFIFFLPGLFSLTTLSLQAAATNVSVGQSYSFSISADGTAPFSYQWFHDGVVMSGVSGGVYAGTAAAADGGLYNVKVANAAGSTMSDTITLVVASLPVFNPQPISQSVTAGISLSFTAAAGGTSVPTYQWRFNGTAIPGETSGTLSLSNVQAVNAGIYTLAATNGAGTAVSIPATLTVTAAPLLPAFTTQPSNQATTLGATVTFTSAATGAPIPTYQWRRNGAAISGATASSYMIPAVTAGSAGTYTVVASNSTGSVVSSGAVLIVNAAAAGPVFTAQPASQTVKKGGSVTFAAIASGVPAPSYQWYKNGTSLQGITTASYTISNLTTTNAGTYSVTATNTTGSVTSVGAALTITSSPLGFAPVDFNADNKSDLVWQNMTTGELAVSFMNGPAVQENLSLGIFDPQWKVGAVADFNADGAPDILCQNTVTGEWSVWLMSGVQVANKISLGIQPLNFRICAAGDFNGDGNPDIVVQNSANGQVSIWLMTGTQRLSITAVATLTANWQICSGVDLTGDGQSGLILQNSVTGQVKLWYMSGTRVTWKTGLTTVSPEWQVCGSGDFYGDGKSEILCQNVLTGESSLWSIVNNAVSKKVSLGTLSVDWVIRN